MALTTIIARLRMCSDALAEVDCWENFFPIFLAIKEELESILPKPYIGTSVPLPPAKIFEVWEELFCLQQTKINVADFLCDTLDPFIEELDKAVYSILSIQAFNTALGNLIQALALLNSLMDVDEDQSFKIQAQQNVHRATTALWTAFSALPEDERKYRFSSLTAEE